MGEKSGRRRRFPPTRCVKRLLPQFQRQNEKALIGPENFFVVHLNAPVEVCRERDQEGLYHLADQGDISHFPGVSARYEDPIEPDLVLPTHELSVEECVDQLIQLLDQRGVILK